MSEIARSRPPSRPALLLRIEIRSISTPKVRDQYLFSKSEARKCFRSISISYFLIADVLKINDING